MQYAWERTAATVPDVPLDEFGGVLPLQIEVQTARKRRLQENAGDSIRRGVIRYLYLVLDWSSAMDEDDFRPTRAEVVYKAVVVCVPLMLVPFLSAVVVIGCLPFF
jgi:transcription initiation factor TFIIH subunit 2